MAKPTDDHIFEAPLLSVVDVWEDLLVLRVVLSVLTTHGRPTRWEVWIESDAPGYKATSRLVTVTGKDMSLQLDELPPHSGIRVRVRGVDSNGNIGAWGSIEQALLPLVSLTQEEVEQDFLNIRWNFADWSCPITDIVSKFELRLATTEREVGDPISYSAGSEGVYSSYGSAKVSLPASPFHNRMHVIQMKCWSSRHQKWSSWSRMHRVFSLAPVRLNLEAINEESVTVVWGRYGGQRVEWPKSRISEEDVGISKFEVFAWKAIRKNYTGVANDDVKAIEAAQLHLQEKNITIIRGLEPSTTYNVKVRWQNRCGGCSQERFFRFVTSPLPRLHQISAVGATFMDVLWFLPRRVETDDLEGYISDDRSANFTPQDATPGGRYGCAKQYTHVVAEEAMQVTLMHTIRAEHNGATAAVKEVAHNPDEYIQRTRIDGLTPGTPFVVAARSGGASYADVQAGLGAERSQWGRWTHSVLVTTLNEVSIQMAQRGHDFFDLCWNVTTVPRVMGIDPSVLRLVDLDEGQESATSGLLQNPHSRQVDPMQIFIGVDELSSSPAHSSGSESNSPVLDTTQLVGENDKEWGIDVLKDEHHQLLSVFSSGVCKFEKLKPNTTYRISTNVCDAEGNWSGCRSLIAATLPPKAITTERLGKVHIDEAFHLQHQELPPVGKTGEGKMHYEVVVDPAREKQLKIIATANIAKVGNVALLPAVEMLGHDHAVLQWKGFTPGRKARVSKSSGMDSVVNFVVSGDDEPPQDPDQSDEEDDEDTAADRFNLAVALWEYRVRLEWRPMVSTTYNTKEFNLGEDPTAKKNEEGTDVRMEELYFRSCTRRTRIGGLSCDYLYKASICMFDPEANQWTHWSDSVEFAPIHTMSLFMKNISINGILVQWLKRPTSLQDVGNTAPTIVKKYMVSMEDLTTPHREELTLHAPKASFTMRRFAQGVTCIKMRPCYAYEAWGPSTPPLYVGVIHGQISCRAVAQDRLVLQWPSLLQGPFANHWSKASVSVVLVRLEEESGTKSQVAEVPFETTRYTFKNLSPSTSYKASVVGVRQLAPNAQGAPPKLPDFTDRAPLLLRTLAPTLPTVEHCGEDFANIRWPRVPRNLMLQVGDDGSAESPDELLLSRPSPQNAARRLVSPGQKSLTVARLRSVVQAQGSTNSSSTATSVSGLEQSTRQPEQYVIVIVDVEFGHKKEERVTCPPSNKATTMSKRVTGLTGGAKYRIFIQPILADGNVDLRSEGVVFATLSPLQLLPSNVASNPGHAEIRFKRTKLDVKTNAITDIEFRNTIEVRVHEMPKAPVRKLSGLRSLLAQQKKYFSRRFQVHSTDDVISISGVPAEAKLCITARQRSHEQVWSATSEAYLVTAGASTPAESPEAAATVPNKE